MLSPLVPLCFATVPPIVADDYVMLTEGSDLGVPHPAIHTSRVYQDKGGAFTLDFVVQFEAFNESETIDSPLANSTPQPYTKDEL